MNRGVYTINHGFFDFLNSDSAYILGYMYGDGCISRLRVNGRSEPQYAVRIYGSPGDEGLLQSLLSKMKSNHPVRKIMRYGHQTMCGVNITSKKLFERLEGLGMRTVNGMRIPELADELFKHFVRGFLDSDGHVGITRSSGRVRVALSSKDFDFLQELSERIERFTGLKRKINVNRKSFPGGVCLWGTIWWHGKSAQKFLDFCKPGKGGLCLKRKWGMTGFLA